MRKLLLVSVAVIGLMVMVGSAVMADDDDEFSASMNGYRETPAVSTVATGRIQTEIDNGVIEFRLTYSGLEAPVTAAHIHFGQPDVSGGVSAFLCGGGDKPPCPQSAPRSAPVTGTIDAADVIGPTGQGIAAGELDELIRAMRRGVTYANVHTDKFPAGEIRGNLEGDD
jgi:hypothetical protein